VILAKAKRSNDHDLGSILGHFKTPLLDAQMWFATLLLHQLRFATRINARKSE
jgi:hypothetical protein